MNTKQRVVMCAGLFVVMLMAVFPPWTKMRVLYGNRYLTESIGARPLFLPPRAYPPDDYNNTMFYIDKTRLLTQFVATVVVTGGLILVLGGKKANSGADAACGQHAHPQGRGPV